VLANLTGVCYWWGWVPTCGLTAILSADALHSWYLPGVPVHLLAAGIVLAFMAVNLSGVRNATRLAIPIAAGSTLLALLSTVIPVLSGGVNWGRAFSFHLATPFHGAFGAITSAMAGLYLIGFAAPAFEAAACHVGETIDPARNVPKAMFRAAGVATLYFVVIPIVWLGVFGPAPLEGHLASVLGPAFAPLFGGAAKAAAVWFMVLNMFHGTLQPLAGAARTLSQLAEDGLLPESWTRRNRRDVPWITTALTAGMAILFLQSGDPTWVIAAANLAYLIGIALPSVAVWLLRRNEPERARPYRAPRGTIMLGVVAAGGWLLSTLLGFEQFGLPTVMASLGLCYACVGLYAWRCWRDSRQTGVPWLRWSLHAKLTAAMIAVIALDGGGYLIAIAHVNNTDPSLVTVLKDIFVGVALLTINVGLVIPGIVSHAVGAIAAAARRLSEGTLSELTAAMQALGRGDLDAAVARAEVAPLEVRSRDELGEMAMSFNRMQTEIGRTATALGVAREELRSANYALASHVQRQAAVARLGLEVLDVEHLDDVVGRVMAIVREVMGADSAVLFDFVDGGECLRVRAQAGLGEAAASAEPERPIPEALRFADGLDLVVPDWVAARQRPPRLLTESDARATLAVAVVEHGHVYGALAVNFTTPREFAADEIDTIRAIANLLASSTEREQAAQEMRRRALHDPLTGLPNRTLFVDRLDRAIAHCTRRRRTVAVLFLDIDYFKVINDSLGHTAGDELLIAVGGRLAEAVRHGDTVARFGGDEFLIICEDAEDPVDVTEIATRIIDSLREPFTIGDVQHVLSTSVGISLARDERRTAEDMIREADAAMYLAKEGGRDRFEIYDEVMRAKATKRLTIESDLRSALERDELRLAYQPVVDLATGRIEGVEALVRWQHPTRGLLFPGEFIPVAEQTGTIRQVGEWVLRAAARQAAEWRARVPHREIPVAVNLSARQVTHHSLLTVVDEAVRDARLDPSLLHLEITESVLMDPSDTNIERLDALKELGVSVVLDDFGTGYSSLAYVKRFPIDILKIDQAFVRDLTGPSAEASIVEAIIAMARGLRVGVIAEGVEELAQATMLRGLGCTRAQGYLFASALWPEAIEQLLESGSALGGFDSPAAIAG
jgi:diguanylate cyclase (GGDEF)-like protein